MTVNVCTDRHCVDTLFCRYLNVDTVFHCRVVGQSLIEAQVDFKVGLGRVHRVNQLAFVKFFTSNVSDPFAFLRKQQRGCGEELATDGDDVIHVVSIEPRGRSNKNVVRLAVFKLMDW